MIPRTCTIIGEAPNPQGKEKYETQTGKRLLEWAGRELPWWNIHGALPPRWSATVATARAHDWLMVERPDQDEPLILLGKRVQAAFGLRGAIPLEWYARSEHKHPMIALPHPSPANRWYNDPENVRRTAELLRAVAAGELPRFERGVKT